MSTANTPATAADPAIPAGAATTATAVAVADAETAVAAAVAAVGRDLDGAVALVTGASSGIGEATVLSLAARGVRVVAAARRADRLHGLADRAGNGVTAVELDVTDEAACRAAVARTVGEHGGLDILVNNAGVMLLGPIEAADTEDWRRMITTNVLGLMYLTHAALPHLLDRAARTGVADIIGVSSVAGRVARSGAGVYNASKFAVNAFSESLRQEVTGRGVRVTLVEPGAVATELTHHITHAASREQIEGFIARMRPLRSEDIAEAVLYVVSQPPHVSVNEVLIRPTDQER